MNSGKDNFQLIERSTTFDSGHRVMNEKMKCFNMHGHTYLLNVAFSFSQMEDIGYAIDFKEIKRIGLQWIDDVLDHGMILNPMDKAVIECTKFTKSKLWLMSLNGEGYCNPSAENLSKEIFLAMEILFMNYPALQIHRIDLNETPKCKVVCFSNSISDKERALFSKKRSVEIKEYLEEKGFMEYDDRKL